MKRKIPKTKVKETKPKRKTNLQPVRKYNIDQLDLSQVATRSLKKLMTKRQILWAHFYIRHWNGSEAARQAGYSLRSAGSIASENLQKPVIMEYVSRIKKNVEEEVGISKIRMLEELKCVALSNLPDMYDDWVTRKQLEDIREQHPHLSRAIKEISTKTRTELNFEKEPIEVEYVKVVFHDKLKAIESIFKAMGWNEAEKLAVSFEQPLFPDIN
jgi:phage terminase small subunit